METPLLPWTIFVFFLSFCVRHGHALSRFDIIIHNCGQANVQNRDEFVRVFWKMRNEMLDEMTHDKYSFKEAGDPPNRLYLFSQCMDYLTQAECRICFENISAILSDCFPAAGGRVYSNGCYIRAENYNFYKEEFSPADVKTCGDHQEQEKVYSSMATNLIIQMALKAPTRGGFVSMQEKLPSGMAVHGLATCWKTLDRDRCSACLAKAASASLSCLPSTQGRAVNSGCFLRYADYDFTNDGRKGEKTDNVANYVAIVLATIAICSLAILTGYYVGKSTYKLSSLMNKREGPKRNLTILKRNLRFIQFKYSTLEKATDDFNESAKLGQGGYGEVYKGTLPDGREIAIKRTLFSGKSGTEYVYNEMDVISRVQHKNLIRFLGFCFTSSESFIIYEYLPGGSLSYNLFDSDMKKQLDWPKRRGIIVGMAEGLEYLHNNPQVQIIHRDIKASNILLDLKYKPKIADFGLARIYSSDKTLVNTGVAGTMGYMAPEYLVEGRLTEKVDIYGFGVLVLEIISGVANNKFEPEDTFENLVGHAWRHFQSKTTSEIIDESMEAKDEEEIIRVVQVGLLCTQELPSLRPNMSEVTRMLKQKDAELPAPSKPPFTKASFLF